MRRIRRGWRVGGRVRFEGRKGKVCLGVEKLIELVLAI